MATREDVKAVVLYIKGSFPNYRPELDGEWNTVDVLLDQLGDLNREDLMLAVRAACVPGTGREFAPSGDEIRRAFVLIQSQVSGTPTAGEAWGAVIGSFERMPGGNMAGGGHGPVLDNPLVKEVVKQLGGWTGVDYEDQMASRAHFLKLYNALYEQELSRAAQLPQVTTFVHQKQLEAEQVKLLES